MTLIVSMGTSSFAEIDFSKAQFFVDYVENVYYQEVDEEEIMEAVYRAIFDSLDMHSAYFDDTELQSFSESSQGEYGGLGITITMDEGALKIIKINEEGPAAKSGLMAGDYISKVDGESILNIALDVAAGKIKGEPGTVVVLSVIRNGSEIEVSLIREIIEIKNVHFEVLEGDIAYIQIDKFAENTNHEVQDAVRKIVQNNLAGIIIDVRDNPGGLVDSVVDISELFLEKDAPILHIDYRAFKDEYFTSNIDGIVNTPMVVLVNKYSASAAEIFASAMQDNDRAIIVGETTYGKGTVQSLKTLNDKSGFKLTIAEYLSANDNHIDGVGVIPDIKMADSAVIKGDFAPMNQKRDIYLGETSLNVYGAQQRLVALGYDLTADGIFGPQTLASITAFQKSHNIRQTGRLDVNTVKVLNATLTNDAGSDLLLEKALELLR